MSTLLTFHFRHSRCDYFPYLIRLAKQGEYKAVSRRHLPGERVVYLSEKQSWSHEFSNIVTG